MSIAQKPWHWTSDVLPDDEDVIWIRPIATSAKPAEATCSYANQAFAVQVGSQTLFYPWVIVPQWRAQ